MKVLAKVLGFFIVFFCITVAAGYVTFMILTSAKSIEVPHLKGKSLLEANEILSGMKLYLKIEGEQYDMEIPSGYILKQKIPAGEKIKEGRTIRVVISKGPHVRYMPDFTGIRLKDAEEMVAMQNINIKKVIYVHSDSIEKDIVISQRPAPEEKGEKELTLIVSSGDYDVRYYCPDFIGKSVGEAKELAKSLGLELEISGPGEKITNQDPQPESIVRKGDIIHLELQKEEETLFQWF